VDSILGDQLQPWMLDEYEDSAGPLDEAPSEACSPPPESAPLQILILVVNCSAPRAVVARPG
jgi:hypothetical protein